MGPQPIRPTQPWSLGYFTFVAWYPTIRIEIRAVKFLKHLSETLFWYYDQSEDYISAKIIPYYLNWTLVTLLAAADSYRNNF